jgi:hypothetical protein
MLACAKRGLEEREQHCLSSRSASLGWGVVPPKGIFGLEMPALALRLLLKNISLAAPLGSSFSAQA